MGGIPEGQNSNDARDYDEPKKTILVYTREVVEEIYTTFQRAMLLDPQECVCAPLDQDTMLFVIHRFADKLNNGYDVYTLKHDGQTPRFKGNYGNEDALITFLLFAQINSQHRIWLPAARYQDGQLNVAELFAE